jgi:hypothetical protein
LNNSNDNSTGHLFLLATLGVLIIWLATRFGIGIMPDSTVYIDAAHNLIDGRGLVALAGSGEFKPLTHYPPFYPATLACLARVGLFFGSIPIESIARIVNSVLFGANVLLVGIGIRSYARESFWGPIIGSSLALMAPDIAGIHTLALTEGLFIFLTLCGLILLARFIETRRRAYLITAAGAIALSLLTRYVGVALVLTGLVVLMFVNGRTLRRRLVDLLIFGLTSCVPMTLWVIRNLRAGEGMSDREFVYHPPGLGKAVTGLSTISGWLLVGRVRPGFRIMFFAVEMVAVSLFAIYLVRQMRQASHGDNCEPAGAIQGGPVERRLGGSPVPLIFLVFTVIYISFLIFTASFVDADFVPDERALVPVHVAMIVLVSVLSWKVFTTLRKVGMVRITFIAIAVLFLCSYSVRGGMWLWHTRQDGQGYASRAWRESKTIEQVKTLPAGAPIFSNGYEAIYYLTHRPAMYLPEKVKHGTGRVNVNFAAEVESMGKALKDRRGVLVYFNTFPERWFLPSEIDLRKQLPLSPITTLNDGSIYKVNSVNEGS